MNCAHAHAVSTALFDAVSAAADTVTAALLPVRPSNGGSRMKVNTCIAVRSADLKDMIKEV